MDADSERKDARKAPPRSTDKNKTIRQVLSRFADRTSMVGVPYINSARFWWAKVIWSFLLVLALAAMTLHLWYLLDQWYSYPKTTKISLGFDALAFPQVTICNTNPLRSSRLETYGGSEKLKSLVDQLDPKNIVQEQFSATYRPYDTTVKTTSSTLKETTTTLEETKTTLEETTTTLEETTTTLEETTTATVSSVEKRDVSANSNPFFRHSGETFWDLDIQGRKKRFVEGYDKLNFSDYYSDYYYYYDNYNDDEYDYEECDACDEDNFGTANTFYAAPVANQTKATNTFTQLFMDVNRKDRADLGHQMEDMLMDCTFNGRECTARQFELHQTSEYGNCWTISSKNFSVLRPGNKGGLSLTLFLESNEYLGGVTHGYGVRMDIKQPDTYPFPSDEGLFIPAGMETDVGLKMLRIHRLGGDYGQCDTGREFKERYNLTYTRRTCQSLCELSHIIEECACFSDTYENLALMIDSSLHPCKDVSCLKKVQTRYRNGDIECNCENPCKELTYIKTVSHRQWPTSIYTFVPLQWVCNRNPAYCEKLREDIQEKWELSMNFLKLNIYYEDLNYESLEEEPQIELQQFLSDVGGAIGLWIGLSILSLCELFQLVVDLCAFFSKRERANRKASYPNRSQVSGTNGQRSAIPESSRTGNDRARARYEDSTNNYKEINFFKNHTMGNVYNNIDSRYGRWDKHKYAHFNMDYEMRFKEYDLNTGRSSEW